MKILFIASLTLSLLLPIVSQAQLTRGKISLAVRVEGNADKPKEGLFIASNKQRLAAQKTLRLPWGEAGNQLSVNVQEVVRVGKALQIEITSTGLNHIRVFQFGADGSTTQLLPNKFDLDTRTKGARILPGAGYKMTTNPPAGHEVIAVVVSQNGFIDGAQAKAAAMREAVHCLSEWRAGVHRTCWRLRCSVEPPARDPGDWLAHRGVKWSGQESLYGGGHLQQGEQRGHQIVQR